MKRRISSMLVLMLFCVQAIFAQANITGQVLDEKTGPLIGATVLVKGTTVGVSTDIDGNFTIKAKPGQTLQVSYVGYNSQEVVVPKSGKVIIKLQEASTNLDEVVVVGVAMKKSDLTGAVSYVDAEVLAEKPVTNINDAISGRVAGVSVVKSTSPSEDSSIKIRGTNTINSGSSPIYVVDGLVMGNDFGFYNSINVNDVESVQVLKDASATALYGSRGANGVIVITTKKGKKGKAEFSYDGWVGFSTIGHRPETMNAQQLFDMRTEAYANGYMYNNPGANRQEYIDNTLMKTNIAFHEQEFAGYKSGKSYDWLKEVTQTGVQHNHNFSFSKATDGSQIYISLGINDLKGIVRGTEQQRYTGRINASTNITPWLQVGTNTSYTYTHDDMTSGSVYSQALYNGNPLVDFAPYKDDATRHDDDYLTLFWRVKSEENNNNFNPFNSYEVKTDRSRYHLTSSSYLNINPMKGLNFRSTFAINHGEQSWNQFIPTGIQESYRHYSGEAFATQQHFGETQWQWDNTISYDNIFNDIHRINAFVGTSASRQTSNYLKGEGRKFASDDLGYDGLFGAADAENRHIYNGRSAESLMSYVARANYTYASRYYLTVTGRWDGSSKFAAGHRWGFFPSFSLAWDITNEQFFPKSQYINQLKLRGGYGVVGNQDIGDFMYATLYTPSVSNGEASYGTDGRRGTPDITWEKQKQTNIGIDMSFFQRRLSASLDVFFINNSNLLMSHNLPTTSGYTYTVENIGELSNKGFELTLSAVPVQTKDFTWNISANLGLDRNEVKKLYGNVERILSGSRTGNIFIGESLNNLYCLQAGGIANENNRTEWESLDFNGRTIGLGDLFARDISGPDDVPDGIVDQYDRAIYSDMDPKFYGGFSTDFSWKGLTLNAIFNYSVGGHALSGYYESLISSFGQSNASTDLLDRWTPENTAAYFPRRMANVSGYSAYGAGDTDRYVQSTSFLRLSNLTLSYNLPKSLTQKWHMNNLRVYFTASNVFTLTGYKGFDPEYGDGSGYYPTERTYTLGLSLSIF